MIASSEATDVLRNGWNDVAAALAPDLPDLASLLRGRLDQALSSGQMGESELLAAVDEVVAIAEHAGSTSAGVLGRRLRRTVYEYLLALDASAAIEGQASAAPAAAAPLVPAALESPPVAAVEATADSGEAPVPSDEPAPRRFGLWRRHPSDREPDDAAPGGDGAAAAWTAPGDALPEPPMWSFPHPAAAGHAAPAPADEGEADAAADVEIASPPESATAADAPGEPDTPSGKSEEEIQEELDDAAEMPVPAPSWYLDRSVPPVADAVAEFTTDGEAATETAHTPVPAPFVAPRDGFHIVDGAASEAPSAPPAGDFAVFSLDDAPAAAAAPRGDNADEWLRVLRGNNHTAETAPPPGQSALAAFDDAFDDDERDPWRVREAAEAPPARGVADAEDPFALDVNLDETRRKIQERLRRKRCDEAAAMLQSLAQEAGGRAVAELAMDAGDRCRALGKTNAALNCYLAASRSDPVFELPLSRLADICIDDQDIELAVSYLERIARLARMRGDERAALRVYRRIATVAPYREDILALLMNAHSVGRLDP